MKKGFLTLVVALLTLVGMMSFGAVPELFGVPDILIGDLEDAAETPNWFEFPDAFDIDLYLVTTTGTMGALSVIYEDASVDNVIRINNKFNTEAADIYAVSNLVSFRNMLCTPYSGVNTSHPVGTSTPVIVDLRAVNGYNPLFTRMTPITVYTVALEFDDYTGIYEKELLDVVTLSGGQPTPPWTLADYPPLAPEPGIGFGMQPCDGSFNTTDGAYVLETTGEDNDFGFWSMLNSAGNVRQQVSSGTLVDYVDGAGYIVTANVYAVPVVTTRPTDSVPPRNDFVPWIRLRMNSVNETVSQEMDILSTANGTVEVTTNPAFATTEVMVFDPMDQREFASGLAGLEALYFSFDLIDFSALNRTYAGERDEEGLVGIVRLEIETFPMSQVPVAATKIMTYPVGANLQADAASYTSASFSFGGSVVVPGFSGGNMTLSATNNVVRGFGWFQLTNNAQAVIPEAGKYYMFKYFVTFGNGPSTTINDPAWMRLRVFYGDNQRSVNYGVRPTGDFNGYQFNVGEYNVFMVPKAGEITRIFYAFDYLDFIAENNHGTCTATLSKVEVWRMDPPPAG